jgi:hypothetical protein
VLQNNIGQESQIRKKKGKALSSFSFLREENNREPIRSPYLGTSDSSIVRFADLNHCVAGISKPKTTADSTIAPFRYRQSRKAAAGFALLGRQSLKGFVSLPSKMRSAPRD